MMDRTTLAFTSAAMSAIWVMAGVYLLVTDSPSHSVIGGCIFLGLAWFLALLHRLLVNP